MSINSFGHLFRLTTWGESHGPAIGCVVDGCPPGLELDEAWVQHFLDLRRPGTSKNVSPRQEPDQVRILSGVYEGRTTGTPIAMMIDNVDARPADYAKDAPHRPGHADFAYDAKYGLRDPRGGGRASARETAMRVAGGAVARLVIPEVNIAASVVEIGGEADESRWEAMLDEARAAGDSLGAIVECVATGVPAGLGRADLCQARCRAGGGLHGDQRGQGRRDRRGFCGRPGPGQRKHGCQAAPAESMAGFRPARRSSSESRSSRPRASAVRAATTPASAFAARRWSRRWSRWCWPTISCCTAGNAAIVAFEPVERLQAVLAAPLRLARG